MASATSAPSASARSRPAALRATATTQRAPFSRAACTATCPTTPLAPSTTTVSPGTRRPRSRTGIQPASPAMPSAAAAVSSSASGTGTRVSSGAETISPKAPVIVRHHTRVPDGRRSEDTTSPTASAPAVNGGSGSGM